jgi:hypothetical protein
MKERLISAGVQLAIIAGLWYAMGLVWQLVAVLAAAAVVPLLFPYRFERIIAGVAMLGVAAFFYFWGGPGWSRLAAVLVAIGVIMIGYGVWKLKGTSAVEA